MNKNIPDNSGQNILGLDGGPRIPHVLSRMMSTEWLGTQHGYGYVSLQRCSLISPQTLLEKHQQETPLLGASSSRCYVHWENQL